jgi:hypothetical protein
MNINLNKTTIKMQKVIIKKNYEEFQDVVNTHLSTDWVVMPGTFQICGIGESDDYEFRYGVVLEKSES